MLKEPEISSAVFFFYYQTEVKILSARKEEHTHTYPKREKKEEKVFWREREKRGERKMMMKATKFKVGRTKKREEGECGGRLL